VVEKGEERDVSHEEGKRVRAEKRTELIHRIMTPKMPDESHWHGAI